MTVAGTLFLGAVVWVLIGLALGYVTGRAISRADAIENTERAETVRRHPSARALTDAEVEQQIRQLEQRWTA